MIMITVNNSDVSFPYNYHAGGKWVTFRTLYRVYSFYIQGLYGLYYYS